MMSVQLGRFAFEVPEDARVTVERRVGQPLIHRYFAAPLVIAVTVAAHEEPVTVERSSEALLNAYRARNGFEECDRQPSSMDGSADEAATLAWSWSDARGVPMSSDAVVGRSANVTAVVHVAHPAHVSDEQRALAARLLESAHFTSTTADGSD